MDPIRFLDLAKSLLPPEDLAEGSPGDSATLRTAISRAYYAVHHHCAGILNGMGVQLPSQNQGRRPGDDHRFVTICWLNSSDGLVRKVGGWLADLHSARTAAHYYLDAPESEDPDEARFQVDQAEKIVRELKTVCANPSRRDKIAQNLVDLQANGHLWRRLDSTP